MKDNKQKTAGGMNKAGLYMRGALVLIALVVFSAAASAETIELTVDQAVDMALENNPSIISRKLAPAMTDTSLVRAEAAFDPEFTADFSMSNSEGTGGANSRSNSESFGISKRLTTGGTLSADLSVKNADTASLYTSSLGITFNQPLFNGAGSAVNLAGIRQAEISSKIARYQLQGYAETLVKQVIDAYWNYSLAKRRMEIYEDSLKIAEDQLAETEILVKVGKLAEVELTASRAEVASRKQSLIEARSQTETLRLTFMRLVNPDFIYNYGDTEIVAVDELSAAHYDLGDAESHIATAMEKRPDLQEALLQLESGELELVQTRNGLLPYLSFYASLGESGYARTLGASLNDVLDDESSSLRMGLSYQYTLGKRTEKATHQRALLSQEQSKLAVENYKLLIHQELRAAWIELVRSESQIEAAGAALELQEEKLRLEEEKFRVGQSTSLDVAQVQRDYLSSRVSVATAMADYVKAVAALAQSEGTILDIYGVRILD